MQATLGAEDVAKRKVGRPSKPGGEGRSVRIEMDIVTKARIIAMRRGTTISDYMASLMRAQVDRDYKKTLQEMTDEDAAKKEAADK